MWLVPQLLSNSAPRSMAANGAMNNERQVSARETRGKMGQWEVHVLVQEELYQSLPFITSWLRLPSGPFTLSVHSFPALMWFHLQCAHTWDYSSSGCPQAHPVPRTLSAPFSNLGTAPTKGGEWVARTAQLPSSGEINPGLPYTAGASVRSAGITFSESVARGNSSLWSRQKRISRTYVT